MYVCMYICVCVCMYVFALDIYSYSVLFEGHFGKVYKGKLLDRDFSSHKIVAVKTIQGEYITNASGL